VKVLIRDWRLIAMLAGAALLGSTLLWAWHRTTKRRTSNRRQPRTDSREARGMPPLSPDQEALARLDALEASGALDADTLKESFLEMSEIFRYYLGRRFAFSALDLTSSEMRSRLAKVDGSEAWLEEVQQWLSRCDLIKYANSR